MNNRLFKKKQKNKSVKRLLFTLTSHNILLNAGVNTKKNSEKIFSFVILTSVQCEMCKNFRLLRTN